MEQEDGRNGEEKDEDLPTGGTARKCMPGVSGVSASSEGGIVRRNSLSASALAWKAAQAVLSVMR